MVALGIFSFFFMGLTLGLIGGGGSILTVPILVYIFKQDPLLATSSSLFIVGVTAAAGGVQYLLKKQVDLKTVFLFSIPSFLGVYFIRKIILPQIPNLIPITDSFHISKSLIVMISFSIVMLVASYKMIRPNVLEKPDKPHIKMPYIKLFKIIFNGLFVGCIAGFVGAGGGFLIVPTLTVLLKLPMRIAVGSSLLIISIQSILGFLSSTELNLVDWNSLFFQIGIAVFGILIGGYFNQYVPEKKLKIGFGYFVLLMGIVIVIEQIYQTLH